MNVSSCIYVIRSRRNDCMNRSTLLFERSFRISHDDEKEDIVKMSYIYSRNRMKFHHNCENMRFEDKSNSSITKL